MNRKQFENWMYAVDEDLLEEAQTAPAHSYRWLRTAGALAACFCLAVLGGYLLWPDDQPQDTPVDQPQDTEVVTIVNPLREITAAEVAELGYVLPLPENAEDASYIAIEGETEEAPMVQVSFTQDGTAYSIRALKAEAPEDISGIYEQWTQSLDWTVDGLSMQLRENDSGAAWVGWYAPEQGTQWCISGEADGLGLLHTAQSIVESLGYDLAVAPAEAEDVIYNAFLLEGLAVGETIFTLEGVSCAYRMAATPVIEENFADLSEADGPFEQSDTAELQWCQAKLFWNQGGEGKIIWFDVAPGLLYSLHMDKNASREALVELASQLFVPAQGEVG